MKLRIDIQYETLSKYRKFCYLVLNEIKIDMINNLDKDKFIVRKKFLDEKLSRNFNYYALYRRMIMNMYLKWENEGYYSICLDDSLKVQGIKVDFIFRMIEYGVEGMEPYPFMRMNIIKYSRILDQMYSDYCEEGRVDLFIRRRHNRRPKVSARR